MDTVQARLRAAMATEQPASTAGYDNMRGSDRLRAALASHMRRVLAPDAPADAVHLSSASARGAAIIDNLFLAITSPGDGVLIPAQPAATTSTTTSACATAPSPSRCTATPPTRFPPGRPSTRCQRSGGNGAPGPSVLLTNPSNPLGVVYQLDVVTVARWALDRGLHVVVDEVYASSAFDAGEKPCCTAGRGRLTTTARDV